MIERKSVATIELSGERKIVLEKLKAAKKLADDLSLTTTLIMKFHCDSPNCGFTVEIKPDLVNFYRYCPMCGTKDGTHPFHQNSIE